LSSILFHSSGEKEGELKKPGQSRGTHDYYFGFLRLMIPAAL
jgi:hypothetical protein